MIYTAMFLVRMAWSKNTERKQKHVSPTSILNIVQDVKTSSQHNLCNHLTKQKKEILSPLFNSYLSCPSLSLLHLSEQTGHIYMYIILGKVISEADWV